MELKEPCPNRIIKKAYRVWITVVLEIHEYTVATTTFVMNKGVQKYEEWNIVVFIKKKYIRATIMNVSEVIKKMSAREVLCVLAE